MSPIVSFDPRPLYQRTVFNDVIESFRCDLLSLHEPPAFLDILIPSTKKVENDHTYACSDGSSFENNTITATEFSTLHVETTNVPVFSQLKGEELFGVCCHQGISKCFLRNTGKNRVGNT